MEPTDGQIVEQVRAGDREAFGGLVDRYRDMVYGLGYHLTGDFEAARDLAQEAFVQAYRKLVQLREPDKFAAWLRRIATNTHRAQHRRQEVATVSLDEATMSVDTGHPSEIEAVVREALSRLRAPERLTLTLHYINGYSQGEIGGFLGVSAETVKTRLARARQHLRTEVMAMVEETFRDRPLGDAFGHDVARAVRELEQGMRRGLPSELPHLAATVQSHWQALLAEIRQALPPESAGRAGAGEAIPVGELPAPAQEKLARAAQWLWLDRIIFHLLARTPEPVDGAWVGLRRQHDGQRMLEMSGSPDPKAGSMRGTTLPDRARRYRMSADVPEGLAPTSLAALETRLENDVRRAVAGLRAGIGAQLPAPLPELYAEVQHQFERLGVAWLAALSRAEMRRLDAGERIRAGELNPRAQALFGELSQVDWLRTVLVRVTVTPDWVSHLAESQVTFQARNERTGQTGVRLEHPSGFIIMGPHGVSAESAGDPESLKAVDEWGRSASRVKGSEPARLPRPEAEQHLSPLLGRVVRPEDESAQPQG